jgi:glutamyl/glutaminyl-tRNA synthetase
VDASGRKLSKRDRVIDLRALRKTGITPEQIRARVRER